MHPDHYTSDAICQAMGLSQFIEPGWAQRSTPTLRVVLSPSFHPELCFTVSEESDAGMLSVVALRSQYWAEPSELVRRADREQVKVVGSVVKDLVARFEAAIGASKVDRRYVCVDGMGSESCLVSSAGTKRLKAHVSQIAECGVFVARLVDVAWKTSRDPRVRNAIAQAASYLDIEFALQEVPEEKPAMNVGILGTPEERTEYLRALAKRKKARND